MRDRIQVVELNSFEQAHAPLIAEHIRTLGRGFRREYHLAESSMIRYSVEEASESRVAVNGILWQPRFRFIYQGGRASFTTVNSPNPIFLYYDFARMLSMEGGEVNGILVPDLEIINAFSTDINDYYLVNNRYSKDIAESFREGIKQPHEKGYISGVLYLWLGTAGFGDERLQRHVRAFAESSSFDDTALAMVFYRGRGTPVFFAEGGIYYPLAEKAYCESIQEDFSRIFMKATGRYTGLVVDMPLPNSAKGGSLPLAPNA